MDLLILGFSQSGKTSLFNALTHRQAAPGGRSGGSVGVAKVPDARLAPLTEMFKPQRVVPAEIQYIDTPAMGSGRKRGGGVSGELLNLMQQADAFVHVVRAFDSPEDIAAGAQSPEDIVVAMDLELAFVDLGILERRLDRLNASLKGARAIDRAAIEHEATMLERVRSSLEQEIPVYLQDIPPEDRTTLANFNLTTAKPIMVVLNVSEDAVGDVAALEAEWHERLSQGNREVVALCANLEEELGAACRTTRSRSSAPPSARASRAATGLLRRHTRCWVWCPSSPWARTRSVRGPSLGRPQRNVPRARCTPTSSGASSAQRWSPTTT